MSAKVPAKVGTVCRQFPCGRLGDLFLALSWSNHRAIIGATDRPIERYFYTAMAVRPWWSVRELRRQIDSALFLRYVSVRSEPEKSLPDDAEQGDLLPFKDHYILEFLGLQDEHTERELRKAILANLRQFFLEFGRDPAMAGEEWPPTKPPCRMRNLIRQRVERLPASTEETYGRDD